MPQNQQTEATVVDIDSLEPLSEAEREFTHLIVRNGLSASDAFRRTHDTTEMTDSAVWSKACRLQGTARVQAYRAALYQAGAHSGVCGQMEFVREMIALAERAEQAGNYGAAVNARAQAGRVSGLYIEQVRNVTEEVDILILLDQIEQLAGLEARRTAARRLGVEEGALPTETLQ